MAPKWKKNIWKIPDNILERLDEIKGKCCGVVRRQDKGGEHHRGGLHHLGIEIDDGKLKFPERILPSPGGRRYSKYNPYARWYIMISQW